MIEMKYAPPEIDRDVVVDVKLTLTYRESQLRAYAAEGRLTSAIADAARSKIARTFRAETYPALERLS